MAAAVLSQARIAKRWILPAHLAQHRGCAIRGMVIHQHDLDLQRRELLQDSAQTRDQRRKNGFLVEHWDHDAEFGSTHIGRTYGWPELRFLAMPRFHVRSAESKDALQNCSPPSHKVEKTNRWPQHCRTAASPQTASSSRPATFQTSGARILPLEFLRNGKAAELSLHRARDRANAQHLRLLFRRELDAKGHLQFQH